MRRVAAFMVLFSCLIWNPHVRANGAARLPGQTTSKNTDSPRWGMVAGGLAMFTAGWAPLCAGTRDERCIPIVGAGIVVHRLWTEMPSDQSSDGIVPPRFVAMAASILVLLQAAGAGLTVVGLAVPRREPRVAFTPWLGPGLAGFSARGRF